MKICYVNPTRLIRRPLAELVAQLGDKHEIHVFVPKKPFQKIDQSWHANQSLKKAKVYAYSAVNIPFLKFEWPIPITPMFFINMIRACRADVIHMWTYFYLSSLFLLLYKVFTGRKLILSADTFPGFSFKPGLLTTALFRIYSFLFGWLIFRIPNKVHVYGKSMIPFAQKAGVPKKKLEVLSTGVHVSRFKSAKPVPRKSLKLNEKDFVLLYAGLIVPRKGVDTMLKTLQKTDANVKLLLVGEGPSKEHFKKIAKELGIADRVRFVSWRKDIPGLMKMADALFLPSRGEGLPGIVMEAMAASLPVITSNIPGTKDVITKETGFVCETESIMCYEKAISALQNKKTATSIAKKALREIETRDWKVLAKQYVEMYK